MLGSREPTAVTCIACGQSVARADAREYDKYGDRWERRDKEFEHVCKACHRDLCHQSRKGLEALLVDLDAEGECSREEFLHRYVTAVREPDGDHGRDRGRDRDRNGDDNVDRDPEPGRDDRGRR